VLAVVAATGERADQEEEEDTDQDPCPARQRGEPAAKVEPAQPGAGIEACLFRRGGGRTGGRRLGAGHHFSRLDPSSGDVAGPVGPQLGGAGDELAFHHAAEAARRQRRQAGCGAAVEEPAERAIAYPLEIVAAQAGDGPQIGDAKRDPLVAIDVAQVRRAADGRRLGGGGRRCGEDGKSGKEDAWRSDGGGLLRIAARIAAAHGGANGALAWHEAGDETDRIRLRPADSSVPRAAAMSVLDRLASALGERDEAANVALARDLAKSGDRADIAILADAVENGPRALAGDAIKALYELGALRPDLIRPHADAFLVALDSRQNRLVWGAMTALDTLAATHPELIAGHLPAIVAAAERGSVIAKDKAVSILATLASLPGPAAPEAWRHLLAILKDAPVNQVAMYAEAALRAAPMHDPAALGRAVQARLAGIATPSRRARLEKVLRRLALL
jgi:hypothetical protein